MIASTYGSFVDHLPSVLPLLALAIILLASSKNKRAPSRHSHVDPPAVHVAYDAAWRGRTRRAAGTALSKAGRSASRNNPGPPVRANRGADLRAVEEPKPGTKQLSMAVPRSRPNGGEHSRLPNFPRRAPDFYVEIDGVEFGGWHK